MLSTKQGILSTLYGTFVSLINAVAQFLTIYFILSKYGSSFNGFIRLAASFSFLISTANSNTGLATSLLLAKPIENKDWISANEIYSNSKNKFRKEALWGALFAIIIAVVFSLFTSLKSNNDIVHIDIFNLNFSGIKITGTATSPSEAQIWLLILICLIYSLRNFVLSFWFNAYENVLSALNKGGTIKVITTISELIGLGFVLLMLSLHNPPLIVVFIPILFIGIIRGVLTLWIVRKEAPWLKYYKNFKSYKLEILSKKITRSGIGISLIMNTDILVASIIFGLNVSSTLSLYLIIVVNTRIIMTNFITSFRDFFILLMSKRGRIKWESYCKYELYSYIVSGFTFINLAVLSPYFVGALYGNVAMQGIPTNGETYKAIYYILFKPEFSLIYAFCASIFILIESQTILMNAKGRNKEVTKFLNYLAILYLFILLIGSSILVFANKHVINAIKFMYLLKGGVLLIAFFYLYTNTWKYLTYNSSLKYTTNNAFILISTICVWSIVQYFFTTKYFDVYENSASPNAIMLPLFLLFISCIIISGVFLLIISFIFSYKIMIGIFLNLPFVNMFFESKKNIERIKRLNENKVNIDKYIKNNNDNIKIVEDEDKKIYTIKGE